MKYAVYLCFLSLFAADPATEILQRAPSAPPELAADLLLRLIEKNQILDPVKQRRAIEDAFEFGGHANNPYPLSGGVHTDTRPSQLQMSVTDLRLSSLALQDRAVRAMLRLDPKRGLDLFTQMRPFHFDVLKCEEELVPNVDSYYDLADVVYRSGFTEEDRKKLRDAAFLEHVVRSISSPVQVCGVARLIHDKPNFERLLASFAATLSRLNADPRTFQRGIGFTMQEAVFRLLEDSGKAQVSALGLGIAYRGYLARYAQGPRCSDLYGQRPITAMIEYFNKGFRKHFTALAELPIITEEESKPSRLDPGSELHEFWKHPGSANLLSHLKELRFGTHDLQRRSPEWEQKARTFRAEFLAWQTKNDETLEDAFHMSAMVYGGLLDLVPPGDFRNEIGDDALLYLKLARIREQSPAEWLYRVQKLLGPRPAVSTDWLMAAYMYLFSLDGIIVR